MSIVPVYYQIKHTIREWITNKEYTLGEKLPGENELAGKFGVNRLTIRQAISQLVQEGFLVSKRGSGTFVTENEELVESFSLEFSGFMDDLFQHLSQIQVKSVEIKKIAASMRVREKLGLSQSESEVIEIKRERHKRGEPFAFTINYLPVELGEKIERKELFAKPLLKILQEDLGIQFTEAFQIIQASFANQEVAEKLNVQIGTPILCLERTMYDKESKPVEHVFSSHRGDLYKYFIRFKSVKSHKLGRVWVAQPS